MKSPSAAPRAKQEETGYTATSFQHLLSVYVSPGYSNEMVHIFLAEGLTAGTAHPETDERDSGLQDASEAMPWRWHATAEYATPRASSLYSSYSQPENTGRLALCGP